MQSTLFHQEVINIWNEYKSKIEQEKQSLAKQIEKLEKRQARLLDLMLDRTIEENVDRDFESRAFRAGTRRGSDRYKARFEYKFDVDGKTYTGKRIGFGLSLSCSRRL
jgi:hypothetical protein